LILILCKITHSPEFSTITKLQSAKLLLKVSGLTKSPLLSYSPKDVGECGLKPLKWDQIETPRPGHAGNCIQIFNPSGQTAFTINPLFQSPTASPDPQAHHQWHPHKEQLCPPCRISWHTEWKTQAGESGLGLRCGGGVGSGSGRGSGHRSGSGLFVFNWVWNRCQLLWPSSRWALKLA